MTPQRIVVAGTDTEVGKTFVGCALARAWVGAGLRTLAIKPVESGLDELAPEDRDGWRLAEATGQLNPLQALQGFGPPLAPPVAARRAGIQLGLAPWIERILELEVDHQIVLVEGAGGLLSPLTAEHDTRDLALALHAEILLVAADRLGTLNQVLVTVEALDSHGIAPNAVVLSAPAVADASTGHNQEELELRLGAPVIGLARCSEVDAVKALGSLAQILARQ